MLEKGRDEAAASGATLAREPTRISGEDLASPGTGLLT